MISNSHVDRAKALLLAAGLTLALASPALAQWPQMEPDASGSLNAVITPDADDEDVLKDIDVSKLDWGQLDVDASTLHDEAGAKKKRAATAGSSDGGMTWTNSNQ